MRQETKFPDESRSVLTIDFGQCKDKWPDDQGDGEPEQLLVEPLSDNASVQAFLHGPMVLAGELGTGGLSDQLIGNQQGPDRRNAPKPSGAGTRTD